MRLSLLAFFVSLGQLAPMSHGFAIQNSGSERTTRFAAAAAEALLEPSSSTTDSNKDNDLAFSIGHWEEAHQTNENHHPTEEALKLVQRIATRMSHGKEDDKDDLVQEGVVALMDAMNHYASLTHNTEPFERYAKRQIIMEMSKSSSSSFPLPPQIDALLKSAQRIRSRQRQKLKREPTVAEIAVILQIDPQELERYERIHQNMVSVESTLETDDPDEVIKIFTDQDVFDKMHTAEESDVMWEQEDEEQIWLHPAASLKELIVDREELTPEDEAYQAMMRTDVNAFLAKNVNDVEKRVLSMRFGLRGEALSRKETAKRLRTTKQFVQSIEAQAMTKLRRSYANRYVDPFVKDEHQYIEDSV